MSILHPRRHEWGRKDGVPRVKRSDGPRHRRQHQHDHPRRVVRSDRGGRCAHQECHAYQPDQYAHPDGCPRRATARSQPFQEHHPERDRGDDQSRRPRLHPLLRPHHTTVAAQEHQPTHDRRRPPLRRRGPAVTARPTPAIEDRAGDGEPHAGHEEGRQRLHGEPDRQVGGPPYQVDRRQRRDDAAPRSARSRRRHPSLPRLVPPTAASLSVDSSHLLTPALVHQAAVHYVPGVHLRDPDLVPE